MSKQLLLSETKNFLAFAEDLNTHCIIIFEKDGVFSVHTTREETETDTEIINRISEILLRLPYVLRSKRPSFLKKITQKIKFIYLRGKFFIGKK